MLHRGLTIEEVTTVIAAYQFFVVILEYPTGVIGDYFGHKTSLAFGHSLMGFGVLFTSLNLPIHGYFVTTFFMAVGGSLASGSDVALFKTLSPNFNKDLPQYKSLANLSLVIVSILAGLIAKISFILPLYLTFAASQIGAILVISIKSNPHTRGAGNIFSTAALGLKDVINKKQILISLLLSMILIGFMRDIKTLLGTFFDVLDLDVGVLGLIIGLGYLARVLGLQLARNLENLNEKVLGAFIIVSLLVTSLTLSPLFPIVGLLAANFLLAIYGMKLELKIANMADDSVRASVLSLKNLLSRLFAAVYLFIGGYVIGVLSFSILMLGTSVLILTALLIYHIVTRELMQNTGY